MRKINVNAITSSVIKTSYIPKKLDNKQEFKNLLYKNSLNSKDFLSANINKNNTETLNKTKNSNKLISKNENYDAKNDLSEIVTMINQLETKNKNSPQVIDVAEKLTTKVSNLKEKLNLLKVTNEISTKEQSKQLLSTGNVIDTATVTSTVTSTEKLDQINQVLQSLGDLVKSVQEVATTNSGTNKLNSNNIEQLAEVPKLEPETKINIKSDLSEIVTLINQLEKSNGNSPQVIDVVQKLITKVSDLKDNLSPLKVANEKNTKKQSKQLQRTGNVIDTTAVTSTDKSVQMNQALQFLGDLVKSLQEVATTNNDTNKLNFNNLEQLAEVPKLEPETKINIKNDLSEIVTMINQLKVKNGDSPQVLDVVQKLTTKVSDLKENLGLLKATNEKSTKKQSKQLLSTRNVTDTSEDMSTDKSAQINQALQSLGDLIKGVQEVATTNSGTNKLNSNNLEELVEVPKLEPETKINIKNNLSEIVTMINQLKSKNGDSPQVIDVVQKLTTKVSDLKGNLSLLKVTDENSPQIIDVLQKLITKVNEIKSDLTLVEDNSNEKPTKQSVKTTSDIVTINQKQILSDNGGEKKSTDNKFSDNKSFEEKFLNGLLGKDKDETKISKAVTFMNQFENIKTVDLSKVEVSNITLNKNNFEVDVIKNIKYMETNNIKDLIVKMNPKELGEITIKLTMESGVIKANITAQNKDTYNLLNTNIQDISDRLKNMDIKIHSLDIGIYEDSTFFSKDSNGRNNNGTQNNNGGQNNNSKITVDSQEDISIINNNVIEENQINKFV